MVDARSLIAGLRWSNASWSCHLDVVRPAAAVEQASLGEASGPYGVCHTDPEGNEVDLVPGDALGQRIGTADWQEVLSVMACYLTTSPTQQRDLVVAAAALADDMGLPLRIDLRPAAKGRTPLMGRSVSADR